MSKRSILARASMAGLAFIVVGCGAPPTTQTTAPQAPVGAADLPAPSLGYEVLQHGGGGGGGGGSTCEAAYQACLNAGWSGYWFLRNRRCRRDYYRCIRYGEH